MDPIQTMPSLEDMVTTETTLKNWLTYYKNTWMRNLAARLIDVQTDTEAKELDREAIVPSDDGTGRTVFVRERLEMRKISVKDAVDILFSINELLKLSEEKLPQLWSEESLAVAEDMIPKPAVESKKEAPEPEAPSEEAKT